MGSRHQGASLGRYSQLRMKVDYAGYIALFRAGGRRVATAVTQSRRKIAGPISLLKFVRYT